MTVLLLLMQYERESDCTVERMFLSSLLKRFGFSSSDDFTRFDGFGADLRWTVWKSYSVKEKRNALFFSYRGWWWWFVNRDWRPEGLSVIYTFICISVIKAFYFNIEEIGCYDLFTNIKFKMYGLTLLFSGIVTYIQTIHSRFYVHFIKHYLMSWAESAGAGGVRFAASVCSADFWQICEGHGRRASFRWFRL